VFASLYVALFVVMCPVMWPSCWHGVSCMHVLEYFDEFFSANRPVNMLFRSVYGCHSVGIMFKTCQAKTSICIHKLRQFRVSAVVLLAHCESIKSQPQEIKVVVEVGFLPFPHCSGFYYVQ